MAKQKKSKKPQVKAPKDPRIEEIYEQEVEFVCPTRGLVKQKVKIKRFKPLSTQLQTGIIYSSDSISALEEKDDGLSIYSDGEEPTEGAEEE